MIGKVIKSTRKHIKTKQDCYYDIAEWTVNVVLNDKYHADNVQYTLNNNADFKRWAGGSFHDVRVESVDIIDSGHALVTFTTLYKIGD